MATAAAKTRARDRYLQRTYNITLEDYDNLLAAHGGACWICHRPPKRRRLHVEHDHKTGRVRGLTCFRDNTLLAHAYDNPGILRAAADYIESHEADIILGRGTNA